LRQVSGLAPRSRPSLPLASDRQRHNFSSNYKHLGDDLASVNDRTPDTQIFLTPPISKVLHYSHQSPKMDIQIFTNFALPSKMNIQIFENFNLPPIPGTPAASKKRAAVEAPDDEPPTKRREKKRYKMNPENIKQGVVALVQRYQLDKVQKADLESIAGYTHFVPSVELVEWLVTEARLREACSYELNYYMFAYMEFFPRFLRYKQDGFRLCIGERRGQCRGTEFSFTRQHGARRVSHPGNQAREMIGNWKYRKFTWLAPFKKLFQLHKMLPEYDSRDHLRG
jgi:hypothetical protein